MPPYLWFWTFWHWSTESFRAGAVLRGPIQGIGGHWDEWYRHEASREERDAIAECGRDIAAQRAFVAWLVRHWSPDASTPDSRIPVRFVLGQLALLAPFDRWDAMARHRNGYGRAGISAVVLGEASAGEASDVRRVEALLIPSHEGEPDLVTEGFHADATQLRAVRNATTSVLKGSGLARLLATWVIAGRRPYARRTAVALTTGWVVIAAMIAWTRLGYDPGGRLTRWVALMLSGWLLLAIVGLTTAIVTVSRAARTGEGAARRLALSQLRLRMDGKLTLIGGSAGLAFSLNALAAAMRGERSQRNAWIWRRFLSSYRQTTGTWAATGIVKDEGGVGAVVLTPKTRACRHHPHVKHLLTPHQPHVPNGGEWSGEARPRTSDHSSPEQRAPTGVLLGFAAEPPTLRAHRCRHLADAVLAVGELVGIRSVAANVLAIGASVIMLASIPDLVSILVPPTAPLVVGPAVASPYQIQLNLATAHPARFSIVLESAFWANRRAPLEATTIAGASAVAELPLIRLANQVTRDVEDGVVYVERRNRFLGREFAASERVGRYSLAYLVQAHE